MEVRPPDPRTLVIDKPFGMVLVHAILILLAAWGLLEGLTRVGVGLGLLSPPRIGSVNAELDAKLLLMDEYIQKTGGVDCIFLGSSQFDEAVDPAVFEKAFSDRAGRQPRCFNFSLGTMTASGDGVIARLLAERYHPDLIFVGISARDFSDDFGELTRPLLDDPWVRFSLGEFSAGGWLTEHSLFYRELLTLRSSLIPDYMVFHNRLTYQLTDQGYLVLNGSNLTITDENFIPNFKFAKEDQAGLDQVAALNSSRLQIVFVEVPVHASFLPHYVQADPAAYRALFVEPIGAYLSKAGLPFWQTQEVMSALVPDNGWTDVKHFNQSGAAIFSRWLGERAADAFARHDLNLSSD